MSDLVAGYWPIRAIPGSVDWGTSSKGNRQVAVAVEILDGPCAGRRAVWYGSFSEKAAERTMESLAYLGWDSDDITDMSGIGSADAVGKFEEEEYEGNMRVRLTFINRQSGPAFKDRMTEGDLAAFAKQMKGQVLAFRQKQGAPKNNGTQQRRPPARREEPPPHDDDDLPY